MRRPRPNPRPSPRGPVVFAELKLEPTSSPVGAGKRIELTAKASLQRLVSSEASIHTKLRCRHDGEVYASNGQIMFNFGEEQEVGKELELSSELAAPATPSVREPCELDMQLDGLTKKSLGSWLLDRDRARRGHVRRAGRRRAAHRRNRRARGRLGRDQRSLRVVLPRARPRRAGPRPQALRRRPLRLGHVDGKGGLRSRRPEGRHPRRGAASVRQASPRTRRARPQRDRARRRAGRGRGPCAAATWTCASRATARWARRRTSCVGCASRARQ